MLEFKPLDGQVLVNEKGFYQLLDLYELNGEIFAKLRNGFIRLKGNNVTSRPSMYWHEVFLDQGVELDPGPNVMRVLQTKLLSPQEDARPDVAYAS